MIGSILNYAPKIPFLTFPMNTFQSKWFDMTWSVFYCKSLS